MSNLRCYDYVNHDYATVTAELIADPTRVFRDATSAGDRPELHVGIGDRMVRREIELAVHGIAETRDELDRPKLKVDVSWHAAHHPNLYPKMRATLWVYPLSSTETQLELAGTYEPPLGALGEALDAIAMHGFAEASVAELVRELAIYLRARRAA
jgi:hypothetical protein